MKKLLFVTSDLNNGGAEKWVLDTLTHMDRTGFIIDSYYWGKILNYTFYEMYEKIGINLYFGKLDRDKPLENIKIWRSLKDFIAVHGPYDAIHINGTPLVKQLICLLVAKQQNITVRIVHSHNSAISKLRKWMPHIHGLVQRMVVSQATCVAACSKIAGEVKYGQAVLADPKFCIFRNGIDVKKYTFSKEKRNQMRKKMGFKNDDFIVLHIGRMTKQKNQLFLLKVFKALHDDWENSNLILIGDGPNKKETMNMIMEFGIENSVRYIQWTDYTENYFSAADVFLFPSLWEGFGYVILEAQANGLNCVVSDVVPRDVNVTGKVKFLSVESSVAEWVKAIKELPMEHSGGVKEIYDQQVMTLTKLLKKYAYCWCDKSIIKDKKPLTILRNGIDIKRFAYSEVERKKVRRELNLEERFVLLHIGRMEEQKNHLFLLDVFHEVLKIKSDAVLLLLGDGSMKQKIIEKIETKNMGNNVYILGWRMQPERYYSAADVFLLPSLYEGFPIVAIEAQANGLPCYISDTVTNEINITGNCTFLSLKESKIKWGEAIIRNSYHIKNADLILERAGYDLKQTAQEFRNIVIKERKE